MASLLSEVDDQVAACRAWGHEWPSRRLASGRALPRKFRPRLAEDGYIEVTEECENNCGKKRQFLLLPGGIYDLDVRRTYYDPRHWKRMPRESGVTRRTFQAEVIRRSHEQIMVAARREAAREAAATAKAAARPAPAVFRAGEEGA